MNTSPQLDFNPHCSRTELESRPLIDPERLAYSLATLVKTEIPKNPAFTNSPKAFVVGSFVANPDKARDLDIEVFGVTWDDLQNYLLSLGEDRKNALGIKEIKLTKGGSDGIIEEGNPDHYGNAYFTAQLFVIGDYPSEADRPRVTLQIPLEVYPTTTRYNLNSRRDIPDATLEKAAFRRVSPGDVLFYDPLEGHRGQIISGGGRVLQGIPSTHRCNEVSLSVDRNDPTFVYRAIRNQAVSGLVADDTLEVLLQERGRRPLPTDQAQIRPSRIAGARWELLYDPLFAPSRGILLLEKYGVLKRDYSWLDEMRAILTSSGWYGLLQRIDKAHETAIIQTTWSSEEKFGLVAATLVYQAESLCRMFNQQSPFDRARDTFFPPGMLKSASGTYGEYEGFYQAFLANYNVLASRELDKPGSLDEASL